MVYGIGIFKIVMATTTEYSIGKYHTRPFQLRNIHLMKCVVYACKNIPALVILGVFLVTFDGLTFKGVNFAVYFCNRKITKKQFSNKNNCVN